MIVENTALLCGESRSGNIKNLTGLSYKSRAWRKKRGCQCQGSPALLLSVHIQAPDRGPVPHVLASCSLYSI